MANNIIKLTILIVLSTSICSCSQPETKTSQPQLTEALSTKIKTPNWENISLKSFSGHNNTIWSVAINPQENLIATASEDNNIKLWNAQTGELVNTLTGHTKGV